MVEVLKQSVRQRSAVQINKLMSLVKNLPFFKDRGLKDAAICDTLRLMKYKHVKKGEMVIEWGSFGDDFFLILEGECEVLVPDAKDTIFNDLDYEMNNMKDRLKQTIVEYETFKLKKEQHIKLQQERIAQLNSFYGTQNVDNAEAEEDKYGEAVFLRKDKCLEYIKAVKRFHWRKSYELMNPVLKLGPGKSFGELAAQKEVNVKIAHKKKPRAATVLCLTDCKFAVMSK